MTSTSPTSSTLTRLAWATALATLVVGQLHALARFRTEDGRSDLDLPLTGWWAEPAGRALDPLLSWADPDTVYLTYGKWWMPALLVVAAAGWMVMRRRAPRGSELWGWRLLLIGLPLLALGAGTFYWGQWTSYNALADIGLWMDLPGALLVTIGGTVLGVALLRRGARPRLAGVLLVLTIPALFGISEVTSLGNTNLPMMVAIALLARGTEPGVKGASTQSGEASRNRQERRASPSRGPNVEP